MPKLPPFSLATVYDRRPNDRFLTTSIDYDASMTKRRIEAVPEAVRSRPPEDQELAELARETEASRTRVYVLSDDERAAIAQARQSPIASDREVAAFWRRHGIQISGS
jgi:hypothetical protein